MSGYLFGSPRFIGAKADYRREDFLFARTQSRAMQEFPWDHPTKHAHSPWITPARRARRTRVMRGATMTIAAILMAVALLPSRHHSQSHGHIAAITPAHVTVVAANTTGL